MRPILTALALIPGPALAEGVSAPDWIENMTSTPLQRVDIGQLEFGEPGLFVADTLTLFGLEAEAPIPTPTGTAQFIVFLDPDSNRVSKSALVYSLDPVVCGNDETTVGVDTATAGYFSPRAAAEITRYADKLYDQDKDLFFDWYDPVFGENYPHVGLIDLPGYGPIATSETGWGDGGYPVASLISAQGTIVAVYMDFMGADADGNWLLPDECANLQS